MAFHPLPNLSVLALSRVSGPALPALTAHEFCASKGSQEDQLNTDWTQRRAGLDTVGPHPWRRNLDSVAPALHASPPLRESQRAGLPVGAPGIKGEGQVQEAVKQMLVFTPGSSM